jgi:hypothetical protein
MSFKEFYQKNILLENALGGHMSHAFEALSKDQLFSFFDKLFKGDLSATEKVDGVNLYIGFNKLGKLTFARNHTEEPSTDINKKFPISHPGRDVFVAGFKALTQGFEKLSKEDRIKAGLIDEQNKPLAFINLEIIYGEIPNLIQYSSINNYIVFHSMTSTFEHNYMLLNENEAKEIQKKIHKLTYKGWGIYQDSQNNSYSWDAYHNKFIKKEIAKILPTIAERLKFLADKIKEVSVTSEVVSYYGNIGEVKREVKKAQSKWIFKSQIDIPKEKIKADLDKVAQKWKQFPEYKDLQKSNLTPEEEFELKKKLTTKIGSEILVNLTSLLFTGERKTGETHPKIEGMVIPFEGQTVKITGSFASLNQDYWKPLKEGLNKTLTDFIEKTFSEELDINGIKTITKASWNAAAVQGKANLFLLAKNKKLYSDESNLYKKINKNRIIININDAVSSIDSLFKKEEQSNNVKKEQILKAFRIGAFKLQQLKQSLININNRVELTANLVKIMFGL